MFNKKKRQIEEEDFNDEDEENFEDEQQSQNTSALKSQSKNQTHIQLTKEEIGGLVQYHQVRALELLDVFRKLE